MVMASSGCEPPPSPPSRLVTFQFERNRRIENLEGPYDMVQCESDPSSEPLFIDDWIYGDSFSVVKVSEEPLIELSFLEPELTTFGLLDLLITAAVSQKVKEFTVNGNLVRAVTVRNISRPRQNIKVASDRYAVCHGYGPPPELHRVCLVDGNGETIKCYGGVSGSGDGQLDIPARLELSKEKCILVADAGNRRVRRQTSISSEI